MPHTIMVISVDWVRHLPPHIALITLTLYKPTKYETSTTHPAHLLSLRMALIVL